MRVALDQEQPAHQTLTKPRACRHFLFERCAGRDVHTACVVAGRLLPLANGKTEQQTRPFATTPGAGLTLRAGRWEFGCTHVAMPSPGEDGKPVSNLLEGAFEEGGVNARPYKTVPGPQTDPQDASWRADRLRQGRVKARCLPPRPQRDLRDLPRPRANRVAERTDGVHRLQKGREGATIQLPCVAPDGTGVSARARLAALIAGQAAPTPRGEGAGGRRRSKREARAEALSGFVRDPPRFLLRPHLPPIDFLDEQIQTFNAQREAQMPQRSVPTAPPAPSGGPSTAPSGGPSTAPAEAPPAPSTPFSPPPGGPPPRAYEKAIERITDRPGIAARGAQAMGAESGTARSRFPSDGPLPSWAGGCPGTPQRGGKRSSGKTHPGHAARRKALGQAAAGGGRAKDNSFRALYERLGRRRGNQRARVAVARKRLGVLYPLLKDPRPDKEGGADYFNSPKREAVPNRLVQRLSKLGSYVPLEPLLCHAGTTPRAGGGLIPTQGPGTAQTGIFTSETQRTQRLHRGRVDLSLRSGRTGGSGPPPEKVPV